MGCYITGKERGMACSFTSLVAMFDFAKKQGWCDPSEHSPMGFVPGGFSNEFADALREGLKEIESNPESVEEEHRDFLEAEGREMILELIRIADEGLFWYA